MGSRRLPADLVGGALLVAVMAAIAVAAPLLSPFDPIEQLDSAAGRLLPPGSERFLVALEGERPLLAESARALPGGVEIVRLGERRTVAAERITNLGSDGLPERRRFPLGTDNLGRDVASRLIWAGRTSLKIGALAALVAMLLGTAVGGLAGAVGGWLDFILMRGVDGLLSFPRLFLVIALAAAFDSSALVLVAVLGFTGWMGAARLVRGEVQGLRQRDFVLAARGVGRGTAGILRLHLLPNALTPVIVDTALRAGEIILVESALSFIGLGVERPTPSWGGMIADGMPHLTAAWWISAFPGAAIALTVIGFHLTADGIRDWRDPRQRARTPTA